jgi:hypothetical protein
MKRTHFVLAAVLMAVFIFGCSNKSPVESNGFRLEDFQNPFIGQWQSNIPSMGNAKAVFEFKTDGTFTCIFPDLPQEQGGGIPYNGGYLVKGNVQVTFLSGDGGIGGYTFEVVDNDTINVTEIEVDEETGTFTSGNTAPFTRVTGSPVNKENKPSVLSNTLIGGTWKETTTPYQAEYLYKADGTGTLKFTENGQPFPFDIAYFTFYDEGLNKDILVTFIPTMNAFAPYSFTISGGNSLTAQEITEVTMGAEGLSATYGTAVTFTKSN